MDNWETVKQIQQEIASGAALGSADKENAKYVDSIEGRLNTLKESFIQLTTTTISSDMFKGFISGLTEVVNTINTVVGAFDKLGVATPVVASGLLGIFSGIKSLGTGNQMTNYASIISQVVSSSSKFDKVKTSVSDFTDKLAGVSTTSNKVSSSLKEVNVATGNISSGATKSTSAVKGLGSSLSTIGSTLVSTLANTAIMAGVGIAISLAVQAWDDYVHAAENAMEKHEQAINKINTKTSELKSEKSSLKAIAKEYDELASKTNKSSEELERYNELRNQIAEISPELLVGTDSDGNAILSLNGSLENYISNLDSAIEKQNVLLMQQQNAEASDASDYLQQGVNRDSYKKYERAQVKANVEKQKIEKSGIEVVNSINRFTAVSENAFDSSMDRIKTARENHAEQIEESYNLVAEEQEKINEYSSKLSQKALNKVSSSSNLDDASDDIKSFAKSVTSSLDFSSLKSGQVDTFARNLTKSLKDGQIDAVLLQYQNLREELERTGDTFGYEEGIKSLIPEMSNLLGLNEEVISSMLALDPTFTQATSSLDAYLQSFGKRESMQGFDAETDNLIKQYESFSGIMDDLGSLEAQEVNGEVQFDLTAVAEIVNQEDVPKQVQDLFGQMQSDGKFTDEEMEVMMRISAAMTTDDSTERSQLLDQAQQLIDQLFPGNKIDIGQLDVSAEYQLNESSKKDLADQLGNLGDEEFVATIKANVENYDQLKMYQDAVSKLQGDKSDIQNMITANIDNFSEFQSYEEMVAWLLGHPDIANKYNISVVGADTIDAVSSRIDKLDLSKNEKKNIMVEVQEGDLEGLLGKIDQLPPEKRFKVLSEISQALSGIDTVEARQLNDKITDILAQDNATGKINYVDAYKKLMKKNVNINAKDNATSVINAVPTGDVTKTIWIKAQKLASDAWNWLTGGRSGGGKSGSGGSSWSIGGFSNVSSTPQEASAPTTMSSGFSGISDSPTMASSTPSTPTSVNPSGQVSAKSVGSFGSVLTNPTLSTKISTSFKNIWNTLKYGINLFQELENRIKRTQNQIDLLSSKMEDAVGTKRISYLQTQNKLYAEQAKLQKTLFNSLYKEKQGVQSKLKGLGFTLNKQGNLTSYEEQLLKLEQAAEKAEKKSSGYKGKNNKTKNSLEKSAEKAKQKLEDAKKLTEEYLKLQYTEIICLLY